MGRHKPQVARYDAEARSYRAQPVGQALARYSATVRSHAAKGGCDADHCSLCHAWQLWQRHPGWGHMLPAYWWKKPLT